MPLELLRHGPTGSAAAQTKFPQTPDRNATWAEDTAGAAKPRARRTYSSRATAARPLRARQPPKSMDGPSEPADCHVANGVKVVRSIRSMMHVHVVDMMHAWYW